MLFYLRQCDGQHTIINTDFVVQAGTWQGRDNASYIVMSNGSHIIADYPLDELHMMITPGLWEEAMHAASHLYETWAKHGAKDGATETAMIAFCEAWDRMLE